MAEEWRPIAGWEGLYEVSSLGNVRSLDRVVKGRSGPTFYRGRVLKPGYGAKYALVTLAETGRGRRAQFYIHTLVLTTFVGPAPEGHEACHGPNGRLDNSVGNLRWDTRQANSLDRHRWGIPWQSHPSTRKGMKFEPKPPTKVDCVVCGTTMLVTKRRNVTSRVCGKTCLSEWGRRCERKRRLHSKGMAIAV